MFPLSKEQKEQRLQAGPGSPGFLQLSGGRARHVPWVFKVLLYQQQENMLGAGMAVVRFMCFLFLAYLCFMPT